MLNVACSRDDNDTVSIVGTWNVSSVKMKGTWSYNGQSAPINRRSLSADACSQKSWWFCADGTGSVTSLPIGMILLEVILSSEWYFTYTYDSSSKVLKIMLGWNWRTNIKNCITSSENDRKETVS